MSTGKQQSGMTLRQPATRWQDACPVGNGSIGAMVYGHIRKEQILLNHERLWRKSPKPELADVSDLREEVRALLHNGQYEDAAELLPKAMIERGGAGKRPDPYSPLGWLHLDLDKPGGVFTGYRRGVDFTTAEAWTQWTINDAEFSRRCFVSREHDAVVIHQSADMPVVFDASLCFQAEDRFNQARTQYAQATFQNTMGSQDDDQMGNPFSLPVETTAGSNASCFWLIGETEEDMRYGMVGRVIAPGGTMTTSDGVLSVSDAEELLVLTKVFTDEAPNAALDRLRDELLDLPEDYDQLLAPHAESHDQIFNRCRITLGDGDDGETPNAELLAEAYDGEAPDALLERMYHFGRYLLICSSGELPANLQGVWNGHYSPPWSSDYHNDENIQMNYWQAGPGNMPELMMPLMEYYTSFMDDYRENARKLYGADGILLPIVQTTHALARSAPWVHWTAAAGWMAQHFYDYYSFTGDTKTLETHVLSWLTGCLDFYEDFLVEDENGQLEFCPSLSPENVPDRADCNMVTVNATMDLAVCREVLTHLKSTCRTLGGHQDTIQRCDAILTRLPDYEINDDGALAEWLEDEFPDNYHHRHQSHLYPVFPGLEITAESAPELFEACRTAVEKRLVLGLTSQTGWSMAHMANIFARLAEDDRAVECLDILTRAETGPNLLTYHNDWRGMGLSLPWLGSPPFQIDANFGLSAAVLEMLVVSTPDCIRLLPGLPDRWETGRVDRIACRGQIEVALEWDQPNHRLTAELTSADGGEITLRLPHFIEQMDCPDDSVDISRSGMGECYRVVDLPAGQQITLSIQMRG